jgi:S-adenosylmethionine:tRNA ribosyltransferase-isomerase
MKPAPSPESRRDTKLLVVTPEEIRVRPFAEIPSEVRAGDIWIVNDAATFPASLGGTTGDGSKVEVRFLPHREGRRWSAILFGPGDWRDRTEDRPAPPALLPGNSIQFANSLRATVSEVSASSPRWVDLEFDRAEPEVWDAIYRIGRPIQYAHLTVELPLWSVQTPFASRPWASEMPSAGRLLHWRILNAMRRRGANLYFLTHATGLSTTGEAGLDARLPFPEFYEIPRSTVQAIQHAKKYGARVIAVGTSVMRALEGSANSPQGLREGAGETSLKIDMSYTRRIVDGILTGMHSPGESHYELLRSFLPHERLVSVEQVADSERFLSHEFGDASLILAP